MRGAGVRDVRVMGAIGVVELEALPQGLQKTLQAAFLEKGVWIRPFRNIVYLTPAFVIGDGELDQLTGAVVDALDKAQRGA